MSDGNVSGDEGWSSEGVVFERRESMGVLGSLMYAAACVALLAMVIECFCRRRLKRMRDSPHILTVSMVSAGPQAAPHPAPAVFPLPVPLPPTNAAYFVAPYRPPLGAPVHSAPPVGAVTLTIRRHFPIAPPPSYDQVMASDRAANTPPG